MENRLVAVNNNEVSDNWKGLVGALKLPLDILPSSKDIGAVIKELPNLLSGMDASLRDEQMVKLCIACGVGLFDAAINYIWIQTIKQLRKAVATFGFDAVTEIKGDKYDQNTVDELQDSDLLKLCLELMIIGDEAYYYLNQCRDMRNNCSVAHPPVASIDRYELVNYINRCVKYVLSDRRPNVIGINIKKDLLPAIKNNQLTQEQLTSWR